MGRSGGRVESLFGGRYRVERCLGQGPVGFVSEATRAVDGRRLALKSLDDQFLGAETVARRFARALVDASRLRSAHAARIFEIRDEGLPFAEVELLSGPSLACVIRERGALSVSDAARHALQACEALGEAHALGFIHGNLKLENWFAESGSEGPFIKLTDFGGSRTSLTGFAYADPDMELVPFDLPRYEAPERILAPRDSDPRSDIWSVGIALYVMLTGRFPFEGESIADLCSAVADGAFTHIGRYRPDVPCGLASVVQRCLERDPYRRYQNTAELALALAPFARNERTDRIEAPARFSSTPPVALDVELSIPIGPINPIAGVAPRKRTGFYGAIALSCVMLAAVTVLMTGWWMSGFTSLTSSFASAPAPARASPRTVVRLARPVSHASDLVVAKAVTPVAPVAAVVPVPSVEARRGAGAVRRVVPGPASTSRSIPDVGF
jgi:eukaryotic-like serine/threonine-protein kinase